MIHTTDLYFEAHVTVDPVEDETALSAIAKTHGFRVAELLMKKSLIPSRLDCFMTGRSGSYDDLLDRTISLYENLIRTGFRVRRYKIENTLLDVRLA